MIAERPNDQDTTPDETENTTPHPEENNQLKENLETNDTQKKELTDLKQDILLYREIREELRIVLESLAENIKDKKILDKELNKLDNTSENMDEEKLKKSIEKIVGRLEKNIQKLGIQEDKKNELIAKIQKRKSEIPMTTKELLDKKNITKLFEDETPQGQRNFNQIVDYYTTLNTSQQETLKARIGKYTNKNIKTLLPITVGSYTPENEAEKKHLTTYPDTTRLFKYQIDKGEIGFISCGNIENIQKNRAKDFAEQANNDSKMREQINLANLESTLGYGGPEVLKLYLAANPNKLEDIVKDTNTLNNISSSIRTLNISDEQKKSYRQVYIDALTSLIKSFGATKDQDIEQQELRKNAEDIAIGLELENKLDKKMPSQLSDIGGYISGHLKKIITMIKETFGEDVFTDIFGKESFWTERLSDKISHQHIKAITDIEYNTDDENSQYADLAKLTMNEKNIQVSGYTKTLQNMPQLLSLIHTDLFEDIVKDYAKDKGKNDSRIQKHTDGSIDLEKTKKLLTVDEKTLREGMGLESKHLEKRKETVESLTKALATKLISPETQQIITEIQTNNQDRKLKIDTPKALAKLTTLYAMTGYKKPIKNWINYAEQVGLKVQPSAPVAPVAPTTPPATPVAVEPKTPTTS